MTTIERLRALRFEAKVAAIAHLDEQIAAMEERVLNAATLSAARAFHLRLDGLRVRRATLARMDGAS